MKMAEPTNLSDRRGNTSQRIQHMLDERKQLLALLLQVSSLKNAEVEDISNELLEEFCQVLVDYIAAGHFGLYERIVEKRERRKRVADLAIKIYPRIDATTQIALDFNEKYDSCNGKLSLSSIQEDLSMLGEELTARIELEDKLIESLIST